MANADKKHFGSASQGKGGGSGAMTDEPADLPENAALSNRDKAQHSRERGRDGKWIETQQRPDSELNQRKR